MFLERQTVMFLLRKVLILFRLTVFTSLCGLLCQAHAPLHRYYYGPSSPHHYRQSVLDQSGGYIDLSGLSDRLTEIPFNQQQQQQQHHQPPSCGQLRILWRDAMKLAVHLYGPGFAVSHPNIVQNPFYLTSLSARQQQQQHQQQQQRQQPDEYDPRIGQKISNEVYQELGLLGVSDPYLSPSLSSSSSSSPSLTPFSPSSSSSSSSSVLPINSIEGYFNSAKESSIPGKFTDYSLPKDDLGAVYGTIVMSPDQSLNSHHSQSTSSLSSSPSSSHSSLASSSSQSSPSSGLPPSPSSSSSPSSLRKDSKHLKHPKLGFGDIIANSKETLDSGSEDVSHLTPESSKKIDNFFTSGIWHDHPIDLSFN